MAEPDAASADLSRVAVSLIIETGFMKCKTSNQLDIKF